MAQTNESIDIYLNELYYQEFDSIASRTLLETKQIIQEISLDDLKNLYKNHIPKIEEILKKYNIDVEGLKEEAKKYSVKVKRMYEDGKSPEEASKEFVNDTKKIILKNLKPIIEKEKELKIPIKIVLAISAFYVILFVNTVMMLSGAITFGLIGVYFVAIVLGPMVEEALKNYYIQKKMPWSGTGVTFGMELVMYVFRLMSMGMILPAALLARLIGLIMHFSTTFLQKKIIGDKYKGKHENKFLAWLAGFGIHASWNTLALIYNKEITQMFT